jgi:hypothetical protein
MTLYKEIIKEATGLTDMKAIAEVEDCMRNDIFHSTLDWQTKRQLMKAAKEAVYIVAEVKKMIGAI